MALATHKICQTCTCATLLRRCPNCGKQFSPWRQQRFCDANCREAYNGPKRIAQKKIYMQNRRAEDKKRKEAHA